MKRITLNSPAKLNLVLDVLGKRPDGFHELRTIFERIDLADTITLTNRADGKIKVSCAHPQVPKGPKNLVVKVAQQLQKDFGVSHGVTIEIDKKIPVAAGLAGGSSNGASVLMGLNRLWNLGLSKVQLIAYADALGSDVTFFLHDASFALGTGRGEKIEVLPIHTKLWHVLVTPKVKMLTKDVFKALGAKPFAGKMQLTNKKDNVSILLALLREGKLAQIGGSLANDLEVAILSLRPDFELLKTKLQASGAVGVCFSGSGPSVFALAYSQKHALDIKACFDKRYAQVFVVQSL